MFGVLGIYNFAPGVEEFMVEKSGVESSGLKLVVEKSGGEISSNLHCNENMVCGTLVKQNGTPPQDFKVFTI